VTKACFYCGISPYKIFKTNGYSVVYNGIDRISSKQGYKSGNVETCCHRCNRLKGSLELDSFLFQITVVAKHLLAMDEKKKP
jgi:hypothetical protein